MTKPDTTGSRGNALLERLPDDLRRRLGLKDEQYELHHVLFEADEMPRWAHFPHRGAVVSLTRSTESGATVEVGIVGWEGVAAVQTLLLPKPAGADAVVQVPGVISRAPLEAVRAAMDESPVMREVILAFAGGFMAQVSQHATCNRVHTIEQRLAKWLLVVRDRIMTNELDLTHEFLSHMLGTRRAGATVAVGALVLDGLIEQNRGRLTIVDPEGLEARACECYPIVRDAVIVGTIV